MMRFHILLFLFVFCGVCSSKKSGVKSAIESKKSSSVLETESEDCKLSVITWNLAEKSPSKKDFSFLKDYRNDDIVVIGAQECEDVRPRREEGHRSRAWRALQTVALGKSFACIAQHRMGGLQIAVYVKKNIADKVQGTQILDVACGVGNVLTNKGAVCVLLRIKGKTLAFVNAHLAAHVGKTKERNADYNRIMTSIIARAQPRWLNKLAAQQISRNQELLSKRKRVLSASRATAIGQELKKKYQPWLDQLWNPKQSSKGKLYGGKKTVIPVAQIEYVKSPKSPKIRGGIQKSREIGSASVLRKKKTLISNDRNSKLSGGKRDSDGGKVTITAKLKTKRNSKSIVKNSSEKVKKVVKRTVKEAEDLICPFDSLVFLGDLNYRLELPRLEIELFKDSLGTDDFASQPEALESILEYDQLTRERVAGRAFSGYSEGSILFPPTFKYDKGSEHFDTSSKARPPAWTDRVLYNMAVRAPSVQLPVSINSSEKVSGIQGAVPETDPSTPLPSDPLVPPSSPWMPQLELDKYYSVDSRHSDHRPVCAQFTYRF